MLNHGVWSAEKTAKGYYKYYNKEGIEWYDYFKAAGNQSIWYLVIDDGKIVLCEQNWAYAQCADLLVIGVDDIAPYTAGAGGTIYGCRVDLERGKILPPLPAALTAMQVRLWLLQNGKTDADVQAVIASLKSPLKEQAEIKWHYAATFDRDDPFIADIAETMGWSTEWLDNEWQAAVQII
ncbi:hypothetical protein [Candidatus Tokpelaia sp.]|uniref:hypothetical protein n=1 Tax=Candidatus Tokpelaia sp. TaxID=2233777 RepID=UPI0012396896|nr:hypothetical protein [Candidatus Tokpelaia sp.]KAA6404505.1 hypothetical protein DPQ22_09750 [Candidatus Tokpelaia sp.]